MERGETRGESAGRGCVCSCHEDRTFAGRAGVRDEQSNYVPPSDDLLRNFRLSKVYHDAQSRITSADWDAAGEVLLSTCDDSTVMIQNVTRGSVRHLYSRRYGVFDARFLYDRSADCLAAARSAEADAGAAAGPAAGAATVVRHWDLTENKFVSVFDLPAPFSRHTEIAVSKSPTNFFGVSCEDRNVYFFPFDKSHSKPVGTLATEKVGGPLMALASTGKIAAVQLTRFIVGLYDLTRGLTPDSLFMDVDFYVIFRETFSNTEVAMLRIFLRRNAAELITVFAKTVPPPSGGSDPAGTRKFLIITKVSTTEDAVQPAVVVEHPAPRDYACDVSVDGVYAACGFPGGVVKVWSLLSGSKIIELDLVNKTPTLVSWNPTHHILHTAGDHQTLWSPPYHRGDDAFP